MTAVLDNNDLREDRFIVYFELWFQSIIEEKAALEMEAVVIFSLCYTK